MWGMVIASVLLVLLFFKQYVCVLFVGGEVDVLTRVESVGDI